MKLISKSDYLRQNGVNKNLEIQGLPKLYPNRPFSPKSLDMTEINYWLMKSEPSVYGIKQLQKEVTTIWDGIRNYQARNFMRSMKLGDKAFFYHSNCKPPSIVGMMEVINTHIIDPTQFDQSSKYFDPKSSPDKPTWDCVELKYLGTFKKMITLSELRELYSAEELQVVKKGNRLSIMPVDIETATNLLERIGIPVNN